MNCPKCGHDESYDLATRKVFKCKACHHQYSETSATSLRYSKMTKEKRDTLSGLLETHSVRQAAILAGVSYKTAWRWAAISRPDDNAPAPQSCRDVAR